MSPFHYLNISIEGGMRAFRSDRVPRNADEHGISLAGPQNETKAVIVNAWQLFRWRHELPMNKSMIAGPARARGAVPGSERATRLPRQD
jgi:hypothetical protein